MTRIIVAHRPETIATADRVITLGVTRPSLVTEAHGPGPRATRAWESIG
jgi:hypothetical protein